MRIKNGDLANVLAGKGLDDVCFIGDGLVACRIVRLDFDVAFGLDVVFGKDAADGLGCSEDELVGGFGGNIVEGWVVFWVRCFHDRGCFIIGAAGETLPELFGDVGHDGVDQG